MKVGATGTFAYYSNGDLERPSSHWKMAMVVFHGATRDAFSYFCSGYQALAGNGNFKADEILVVRLYINITRCGATRSWWCVYKILVAQIARVTYSQSYLDLH